MRTGVLMMGVMAAGAGILGWAALAGGVGAGMGDEKAAIERVLDALHEGAATADEDRYFPLFADDAVFLGTDATERWTLEEFKAFAMPRFTEHESAWTYAMKTRHVSVAPCGEAAWFDETLENAGLGDCRGSGALVKVGGAWRITQYNLTIPVPNELADKVVGLIREHAEEGGAAR